MLEASVAPILLTKWQWQMLLRDGSRYKRGLANQTPGQGAFDSLEVYLNSSRTARKCKTLVSLLILLLEQNGGTLAASYFSSSLWSQHPAAVEDLNGFLLDWISEPVSLLINLRRLKIPYLVFFFLFLATVHHQNLHLNIMASTDTSKYVLSTLPDLSLFV